MRLAPYTAISRDREHHPSLLTLLPCLLLPTLLLAYLPRVREYKDVIRTDAEDQEDAEQLQEAHGFL